MKIEKILCPIDFSEFNQLANEVASEMALANHAEIVYLNVPDQSALAGDYGYALDRAKDQAMEQLTESSSPTIPDIAHSHEVRISRLTGRTIVEFADENDIDLIVLSTHGRTGLRRLLIGSVAEYVVRNASCAVLTVKPKQPAPATQDTESQTTGVDGE